MSLRERLQQRARPTGVWPLRIDDLARVEELRAAVEQAESELRIASIAYAADSPDLAAAQTRAQDARRELATGYEPVEFVALAPPAFEDLAAEHPGGDGEAWNKDFPRALFLACVQGDLTPEEWATVLDVDLTPGEKTDLLNAALALHLRVPDPALPKDWTSTRSSTSS